MTTSIGKKIAALFVTSMLSAPIHAIAQTEWVAARGGIFVPPGSHTVANGAALLPSWINTALVESGLRANEVGLTPPVAFAVFEPDQNTRVIVAVATYTQDCDAVSSNPADDDKPTRCPVRMITVHSDGQISRMATRPGCFWYSDAQTPDQTYFRRDPTTGVVEGKAVVNGKLYPSCAMKISN